MDISKRGLDMIKAYEGYADEAYLCPEKVWTIGWGSTRWSASRPVKQGDTCTKEQAEDLLRREVWRIEDTIDAYVKVPLTQGQFDALCSWAYNVGIGWINGQRKGGQATLIKLLNKGRYDKVPGELLKFKRGAKSGKSIDGLIARRRREIAELWLADYGTVSEKAATPVDIKPTLPDVAPMPQAVAPEQPSAVQVVKESKTAQVSILGLILTAIQQGWGWVFGVATEAGKEAVTNQQALGPFEALFKAVGANMGQITAALIACTLLVVIARKIVSERA